MLFDDDPASTLFDDDDPASLFDDDDPASTLFVDDATDSETPSSRSRWVSQIAVRDGTPGLLA